MKKSSLIRPALALALALGLAACGGTASFTISGTIGGLVYPGLVLTNNGEDLNVAPPATAGAAVSYSFTKQAQYGDVYAVKVKTQPAHQTCIPVGGADRSGLTFTETAGRLSTINATFSCALVSNQLSGTVEGLTADGLVLANGSTGGAVSVAKAATVFTLPAVTYGITYGITVLTQPAGLVCSVANGTGTMGDTAPAGIKVSCVPQ